MTATSPSEWIADLRRRHRPETVLTLLQLQVLGPGLYTTQELVELLGVQSSSTNLSLARLKCAGLIEYVGWPKKGRLIWYVADWDNPTADRRSHHPRWVLKANAAKRAEVWLGRQAEAAHKLGVDRKTLSNFLSGRYGYCRLLGEWDIELNPIQFVTQNETHFSQPRVRP
jgi:plasmid maintenance system antidote protein VapI